MRRGGAWAARGVPLSDFPRLVKLSKHVYGYEEIRQPGFTTVSLIVLGRDGVLIADAQGSAAATQTMLDRIRTLVDSSRCDIRVSDQIQFPEPMFVNEP